MRLTILFSLLLFDVKKTGCIGMMLATTSCLCKHTGEPDDVT